MELAWILGNSLTWLLARWATSVSVRLEFQEKIAKVSINTPRNLNVLMKLYSYFDEGRQLKIPFREFIDFSEFPIKRKLRLLIWFLCSTFLVNAKETELGTSNLAASLTSGSNAPGYVPVPKPDTAETYAKPITLEHGEGGAVPVPRPETISTSPGGVFTLNNVMLTKSCFVMALFEATCCMGKITNCTHTCNFHSSSQSM